MGRASRKRKSDNGFLPGTKALMKKMIRESSPTPFVIDGKIVYYNPMKKLMEGEKYKTADGVSVTQEMVKKYEQYLKTRFKQEQIAKANNVDLNKVDE